jgi:hypothetical protein
VVVGDAGDDAAEDGAACSSGATGAAGKGAAALGDDAATAQFHTTRCAEAGGCGQPGGQHGVIVYGEG